MWVWVLKVLQVLLPVQPPDHQLLNLQAPLAPLVVVAVVVVVAPVREAY